MATYDRQCGNSHIEVNTNDCNTLDEMEKVYDDLKVDFLEFRNNTSVSCNRIRIDFMFAAHMDRKFCKAKKRKHEHLLQDTLEKARNNKVRIMLYNICIVIALLHNLSLGLQWI